MSNNIQKDAKLPWSMYGFVLQWRKSLKDGLDAPELLAKIPELDPLSFSDKTGFWHAFNYRGKMPLNRNDSDRLSEYFEYVELSKSSDGGNNLIPVRDPRPFNHTFLLRYNSQSGMAAIVSGGRDISETLIDEILNHHLSPNLLPIQVRIKELAEHFVKHSDGRFKLSYVSADFIDDGIDLEKITLYGKDIANSVFVGEHIHRLSSNQIGMRLSSEFKENAQFGTDGYIRFYPRGGVGLERFETCLSYVAARKVFVLPD